MRSDEKNKKSVEVLRKKVDDYVKRAEEIKTFIDSGKVSCDLDCEQCADLNPQSAQPKKAAAAGKSDSKEEDDDDKEKKVRSPRLS